MKLTRTATQWTLALSTVLVLGISSALAQQATHICDELMRQEHTAEDLRRCIAEFGEPESIRQAREEQRRADVAQAQTQQEREQFFDKTFTEAELRRFGAPYVGKRNFYDVYGSIYKSKTLTDGKDLCKYLGFDKALSEGSLSSEMEDFENRSFVGVTVDKPFLGSLEAKQFRFDESDDPSNIQVYTSITCRRDRKEGDPENSVVGSTEALNNHIQSASETSREGVRENNSSRRENRSIDANSPYLYNPNSQSSNPQR